MKTGLPWVARLRQAQVRRGWCLSLRDRAERRILMDLRNPAGPRAPIAPTYPDARGWPVCGQTARRRRPPSRVWRTVFCAARGRARAFGATWRARVSCPSAAALRWLNARAAVIAPAGGGAGRQGWEDLDGPGGRAVVRPW